MPIPRPPTAVTFDCWSTLIADHDWEATMRLRDRRLVEIAATVGIHLGEDRAHELITGSWEVHVAAWRRGEIFGARGAARWIASQIMDSGSPAAGSLDHFAESLRTSIEDATLWIGTRAVEGAAEALEALRVAGVTTALVCDTGFTPGRHVRKFLDEHGLMLDHYLFSDEIGAPKPFPPIFEAALAATGSQPNQAIHIGDLRRTDIAGARAAGMATVRFAGVHDDGWGTEDSEGEEADAVIRRWADFLPLVGL